jgi:hypothetical protein
MVLSYVYEFLPWFEVPSSLFRCPEVQEETRPGSGTGLTKIFSLANGTARLYVVQK